MDKFLNKHLKSRDAKFIAKAYFIGGFTALGVAIIWIIINIITSFA